MNDIICPDCLKIMKVVDLLDFYCQKANMIVYINENVCLNCGNAALHPISTNSPGDSTAHIGRLESIECTCFSDKPDRNIDQDVLFGLVKTYYMQLAVSICKKLFNSTWLDKFEIILWELIQDKKILKSKDYPELEDIRKLFKNTNLWVINPDNWENMHGSNEFFVTAKEWNWMYKNHEKLLKTNESGTNNARET